MQNSNQVNPKRYNLEERTYTFAKNIRNFIKSIYKKFENFDDYKQLLRSSGSIGANYIEANESLSKKDFLMRIKISRKEAKETIYWLKLIDGRSEIREIQTKLIDEAIELMKIFGSIVEKSK